MSHRRNLLFALVLCALGLHGAAAAAAAALDSQLAACRGITDSTRRLDCYDRIQQPGAATPAAAAVVQSVPMPPAVPVVPPPLAAVPAAVAPPVAQAAPAAEAVQAAPQSFGAETITKPVPVEAQKDLRARLKGSIVSLRRGMMFELDNGQTWQSIDDREYDCEGDDPAVTITRNFAGSYWLQVEHCPYHLRVTRLK